MNYTFFPYVGLGDIRFGMGPEEVKRIIGTAPERASTRSPVTKTWKAYYRVLGLLLVFDDKDRCSSITTLPEGSLFLDQVDLTKLSYPELKAFLHAHGHQFVEDDSGLRCEGLGLTSWRSLENDGEECCDVEQFECLFIFRRGHDEYMKALIEPDE
jgi:hypothetical protein